MSELEREITEALDSICRKLNRGDVGNFQASLGLFSTQNVPEHAEEETVKRIFGASTKPVFFMLSSFEEMTSQFRDCIGWKGDYGAHPNRKYHPTQECSEDIAQVLEKLKVLFSEAKEFWEFSIEQGHPYYPVFWDFAFLIKGTAKTYVFIGSSSD
jgi:hypothetical protein